MHPGGFPGPHHWNYGYGYRMYGPRFRLFPRLFWFALGAGAFAFWSRHAYEEKERRIANGAYAGHHNGEWKHWSGNHFGCHRRREQQQQWQAPAAPTQITQQPTFAPAVTPPVPAPTPTSAQAPAPAYSSTAPATQPNEWDTERIREVGKQASETMAEMSENALDALMANLQALKAKIAEAREERERERLYLEQRIPLDKPDQKDTSERRV